MLREAGVFINKPVDRVRWASYGDQGSDVLVVALGADYDFAATPGFEEGGFEY